MLITYLTFNGNCEEAFEFYKSALNGNIIAVNRFGEGPGSENMPEADKKKLMHISLEAPDGIKLMGTDYMPFSGHPFIEGNNFTLSLHPDSTDKADKLFAALSAGGNITMPLAKVFWGAYFGMFTDKFGINWMINHHNQ